MRDPVKERATLAAKRDFDMLPRSTEIDVQPARRYELSAIAEMGNRMVPGVQIAEPDLERYFAFDPGSILTFSRQGQLLGAVAFLYLNRRGHDALMHAEIESHASRFLAARRSLRRGLRDLRVGDRRAAARRWPDSATCRSIFARRGWRPPISTRTVERGRARSDDRNWF